MDVSKYHTRCPPIEHEEAVRMLLEGLDDARVSRELANRDRLDETTLQRRKRTAITARDNEDLHEPGERSSQLKRSSSKQQSANRKQTTSNTKVLNSNNNNSNNNHNSNSKIKMKAEPGLSSSSVDSGSLARCSGDQEDEFDPDRPKRRSKNQRSMIAHDDNLFEFNSEESGSREFIQVSPQVQSKRRNNTIGVVVPDYKRREAYESNQEASQVRYPLPKMQSKATSTASDSISTSGASTDRATEAKLAGDDEGEGDLNGNYEAIPSRTIAIQCDLRLSSVKRDGYLDSASSDLASMQASSISSTRYGFYRLSPEVIEQRRQLARSVSSRNIAEQQHQQYTPTTGAPLVARLNTVEAPTSISELSSSVADVGEFEPELARIRRRRSLSRETGDGGELRSIGSSDREPLAAVGAKSKHDQRFFSQRQRQQQMNSSYRQDSLPRRPKTALSYVSTSRLRGQQQEQGDDDGNDTMPNRLHSDEDSEPSRATTRALATESNKRMSSRSRAMSQQVLSSSARTTVAPNRRSSRAANDQIGDLINSNSDSELGAEKYRVPQQEELLVTKRGRSMGSSSPQVSRSSAIRNGPLFRRATQTLDSAAISQQQQANPTTTTTTTSSSSRYNNKREHNTDNGSAFDYGRSEEDNNNKIMREGASDSLDLRTTRVKPSASGIGLANYSMAEENQLAAMSERRATLTRQQQQTGHSISQAPRYSSMSLSRRPQRQQRSCNTSQDNNNKLAATSMNNDDDDREPDAGSIMEQPQESTAHDHQHRSQHGTRSTRLLRRDRAGSQQALPATLVTRTIRRVSPTTRTSTRTGEQQAQVGRSSSMKQQGGRPHHTAAAAANLVDAHRSNRWQHFTGPDDDSCDDGAAGNKCKACYGGPGALDERLDCDDSSQQLTTEDHDDDDEFDRHNRPTGARPIGSADRSSLEVSRRPPMASSMKRSESEDSESPLTRTWANPAHTAVRQRTSRTTGQQQASTSTRGHKTSDELAAANQGYTPGSRYQVTDGNRDLSDDISMDDKALDRKSARSHSMREISHLEPTTTNHDSMLLVNGVRPRRFESIYRAGQQHDDADELGVDGRVDFDDRNQHHQDEMPSEEYSICSSSLDDHGGSRGQRLDIPSKATTQAHLTNSQQQQQQQLDFDSQQRLNEIGLPEPSQSMSPTRRRQPTVTGSASHLGLSSAGVSSGLISRYATTGRSGTESAGHQHQVYQFRYNNGSRQSGSAITGRAMSQQSLTRPTMPLSRRLRRSGGTIGAGSGGSDVGGSSISLVSRLRDGSRYENAHTRDPVVMLIPQVNSSKQNEPLRASSRRASSRLGRPLYKTSGSRLSSQERKNRSLSRNGSDSDASSSMLRTLIKPRSTGGAPHARETGAVNGRSGNGMRRRGMASNNLDSDEENLDEIGQLASEIDSYKFRRRYSVPKDAKINWFSKLKQRVTSSKS